MSLVGVALLGGYVVAGAGAAPVAGALLWAQAPSPTPLDRALDEPAAAPPGGEKYVGVAPGTSARNPLPAPRREPPRLIWSGFQLADGVPRVFFQTTQPVAFDLVRQPAARPGALEVVSVFLRNCRIHLRNNGRNLDTRFFGTAVQGVTARQRRKDVELRILVKDAAGAVPRNEPGPDGTHFLVLEFAGGPAVAPGEPARSSAVEPPGPSRPTALRLPKD